MSKCIHNFGKNLQTLDRAGRDKNHTIQLGQTQGWQDLAIYVVLTSGYYFSFILLFRNLVKLDVLLE